MVCRLGGYFAYNVLIGAAFTTYESVNPFPVKWETTQPLSQLAKRMFGYEYARMANFNL